MQSEQKSPSGSEKDIFSLLGEYTDSVKKIYGTSLSKVILFGSYARGDYNEDSDIDIMILLQVAPQDERKQLDALASLTADFNLTHNTYIIPLPKSAETFTKWGQIDPFYKNVNREGRILFGT